MYHSVRSYLFCRCRTCPGLSLISECVKHQSVDLQALLARIQEVVDNLKTFEIDCKTIIPDLQESHRTQIQEMREMCQEICAKLDEIEKRTQHDGEIYLKDVQASLKNDVQNCNIPQSKLEQLCKAIKA